jgi:hypothetical protein
MSKYLHQKTPNIHTGICKSGDSGDFGVIFRLYSVRIAINRLKSVEKERDKMISYKLGSKYIMIRCDYCNKKLALSMVIVMQFMI